MYYLSADFEPIIKQTFHFEGGYDANPVDHGNFNSLGQLVGTNHGISAPLYEQYLKLPPTVADMKAITPEIAEDIYETVFWDVMPGEPFSSQSVAHIIFDGFVNSGRTMFKVVRKAINDVYAREFPGQKLLTWNNKPFTGDEVKKINSLDAEEVFDQIKQARIDFYNNLIASHPSYEIYRKGWMNRINSFTFEDVIETVLFPASVVITDPRKRKRARRIFAIAGGSALLITFGVLAYRKYRRAS